MLERAKKLVTNCFSKKISFLGSDKENKNLQKYLYRGVKNSPGKIL